MEVSEQIIAGHNDVAYLCVGLHNGYGSAYRIYMKRGYLPDGTGVWYGSKACTPYENYCLDDDLVLKFYKKLR